MNKKDLRAYGIFMLIITIIFLNTHIIFGGFRFNIYLLIPIVLYSTIFLAGLYIYKKFIKTSIKELQKDAKFDEYQKSLRYKYGYHALIMLLILLLGESIIMQDKVWAESMVKVLILTVMPMVYFFTVLVIKGAYVQRNREKVNFISDIASIFLILLYLYIIYSNYNRHGLEHYYKNGVIQNNSVLLILLVLFIYRTVLSMFMYFKNKREELRGE